MFTQKKTFLPLLKTVATVSKAWIRYSTLMRRFIPKFTIVILKLFKDLSVIKDLYNIMIKQHLVNLYTQLTFRICYNLDDFKQ